MSQTFGMEAPRGNVKTPHRLPVRYLMLIDSGGSMVARLFLENRELAAEFDATAEEVTAMTQGMQPQRGALGSEWDIALQGHNVDERASAMLYTITV
jgi:hypothetical protein